MHTRPQIKEARFLVLLFVLVQILLDQLGTTKGVVILNQNNHICATFNFDRTNVYTFAHTHTHNLHLVYIHNHDGIHRI